MLVDTVGCKPCPQDLAVTFRRARKVAFFGGRRSLPVQNAWVRESIGSLAEAATSDPSPEVSTSPAQDTGRALIEEASKATAEAEPLQANQNALQSLQNNAANNQDVERALSGVETGTSQTGDLGGSNILDGLQSTFSDVNKSLSDAANNFRDNFSSSVTGGQESISGTSAEIQKQVQDITSSLSQNFDGATGEVGREVTKQLAGLQGTADSLSNQALQSVTSGLSTLPAPLRDTLQAILKALEVPAIRNTSIAFAIGYPAYSWFTARFGGFAGRLSPEATLNLLESEDALLLDIRPDNARDIAGIPELRFGARNKGVALPLVRVRQKTGTQVVKANVLSFQVASILVAGLSKVSPRSKIVVLSDSETQAVGLARAVSEETGLTAYILSGGFSGWQNAGLPIKDDTDYESNAIEGLSDTVEGRILPFIRDPVTAFFAVLFGVGVSALVIDEHKALQFIGALGLVFTFGTIPIRYNSLQEGLTDTFSPVLRVAGFVSRFIPKSSSTSKSGSAPVESTPVSSSLKSQETLAEPEGKSVNGDAYDEIFAEQSSNQNAGTQVLKKAPETGTQRITKTPETLTSSPEVTSANRNT